MFWLVLPVVFNQSAQPPQWAPSCLPNCPVRSFGRTDEPKKTKADKPDPCDGRWPRGIEGKRHGAGPSLPQRVPKAARPLLFKEGWYPSVSALQEGAGGTSEGGLLCASICPCTSLPALPGGDRTLPFARPSPLATTAPLSITESLSV